MATAAKRRCMRFPRSVGKDVAFVREEELRAAAGEHVGETIVAGFRLVDIEVHGFVQERLEQLAVLAGSGNRLGESDQGGDLLSLLQLAGAIEMGPLFLRGRSFGAGRIELQ